MNPIPLSAIINIENPGEYKLHAARWSDNEEPLDVYVHDKSDWLWWNKWRSSKDDFSRKYVFSLIDFYHENDMWLFGGIYEILKRNDEPNSHSHEIKELVEHSAFVGRLKIKLEKPARGRAFYLEKHLDKMIVAEVLKEPYSGTAFPGYGNINHDFSELKSIFKNQKPDWKGALENIKGVYVIFDKSNGKKYVGSAYGNCGIYSRWCCYIETGHGGNHNLKTIIKNEGVSYAEENFKLSLLEYRPMKTGDNEIINREKYWKEVLLSQGCYGYNIN